MVIFNRKFSNKHITPFDKQRIINELVTNIHEKFPDYYLLINPDSNKGYDLLIIASVTKEVKITINSLNPHSRHEEQRLQHVIAISVVDPNEEINEHIATLTESWTTMHLIVSDAETIIRKLTSIQPKSN